MYQCINIGVKRSLNKKLNHYSKLSFCHINRQLNKINGLAIELRNSYVCNSKRTGTFTHIAFRLPPTVPGWKRQPRTEFRAALSKIP